MNSLAASLEHKGCELPCRSGQTAVHGEVIVCRLDRHESFLQYCYDGAWMQLKRRVHCEACDGWLRAQVPGKDITSCQDAFSTAGVCVGLMRGWHCAYCTAGQTARPECVRHDVDWGPRPNEQHQRRLARWCADELSCCEP